MCVSNAIVFYTVPFSFTSPFATGVAFGLMVSLIHGLNLKGVILAMTMYMLKPYIERQTLIVALNPPTVPSIMFLAPLASFCSAFGVLWLLYDLFGYLHASTDDLRDFFGITLPAPSIVTLKDVKDRSITLNWQCSSQATISKHLIEIDGLIIGESGKQETSVVIQGLHPDNTYRIRLWAITTRNWKTPSEYVVVRTLASIPVELELSSVENARRESELIKQLIKESEDMHLMNKETDQESIPDRSLQAQDAKAESISSTSANMDVNTGLAGSSVTLADGRIGSPTTGVSDEQIAALRVELEGKEAAHVLLLQQLDDLEKQYKQQEDNLKGEIAVLREQQRQEDEPRQQAKIKLKELQESLREVEIHKTKVEKEHRVELEKRQRMTEQLEAKHRKLETLQQTLRQSEERLLSEKKGHKQQIQELEGALKKRSEDVQAAESSLKAMQESQKTLCSTIETKELELQKLQATIHSPKGYASWEQKSKDLDAKCAQLTQQLAQYEAENHQLQERLTEASKNVSHVRSARESRRAQVEARKAAAAAAASATAVQQHAQADHHNGDHGSNWVNAGWNNSPGTQILSGLFQDDATAPHIKPTLARKTTGPPPGLPLKINNNLMDTNRSTMESSAPGYGRVRKDSGSQGSMTAAPGSPTRGNVHLGGGAFESPRYSTMSPRARFHAVGPAHSPPMAHGRGGSTQLSSLSTRAKSGSISAGVGNRSPLVDLESKGSPILSANQPFNYHRFFGPASSTDMSSGMLSDTGLANDHQQQHQLNEQTVIKSMFESPDTSLDLRHHLRTVGSHSSLTTAQSKILPSHLRSVSTSGMSSPLSSPVTATLPPLQSSPSWDLKPIARPGTLGRMNSQAEGSSSSLNYSDPSSPTSPHIMSVGQTGSGYIRKPLLKEISGERGFWSGYETPDVGNVASVGPSGWNRGAQESSYGSILPTHPDPWGQFDGRYRNTRQQPGMSSLRDPSVGVGISIEGMLPSPNGSSVSSLETGTSLPVDALVFADHYFSNRSHRGFEPPSSLASTSAFSNPTAATPAAMKPSSSIMNDASGANGVQSGNNVVSPQIYSNLTTFNDNHSNSHGSGNDSGKGNSETDIFGYGLCLNPFGWSLPSEADQGRDA
ncbi:hypothetical protein EDD11_008383 [Mortierella claussenii]|nr:hypothetical protein EDD11_008383 [Mortierella claussenii]